MKTTFARSVALSLLLFFCAVTARAAVTVTVSGPGGQQSEALSADNTFDMSLPLQKNAVNTITVTATDSAGHKTSKSLKVTQLSLSSVVVSKVTAERLSVEQVKQLVSDGVIKLDDPENYNVSKFDLVLTIGSRPVPISVTVPSHKTEEKTVWETVQLAGGGGGGGSPNVPDCVVFEQTVSLGGGGGGGVVSIPGVILIEGRIKSLKEFYAVRLLLMNTSGIFTLKNVMANISFPDGGLSSTAPADGILSFGDILPGDAGEPGQAERQFIVRGDEIGVRGIDVGFGGTITGPGIDEANAVPFNGSASTEVEVKGPPTFLVRAYHPDSVVAGVPYEFRVDITDTGEVPALYASLELDVGAAAKLVRCSQSAAGPVCENIVGSDVRNFGDILPGQTVSASFTIMPLATGPITSCVGVADQNLTLQVQVGAMGCLVGQFPPERGVPDGVPTVAVVPTPNTLGVSVDVAVTAFFSQEMSPDSISTGTGGSFNVYDDAGNVVPGRLLLVPLAGKTVAVWQPSDAVGQLAPNAEYSVSVTRRVTNTDGVPIYNEWASRFTTTGKGADDKTPPTLTLTVMPPVLPTYVLPGQLVTVDAYAADQGSGVARVELRSRDLSVENAPYELVDRRVVFGADKPPFLFTLDSGKLVPGHTYELMGTAYDAMMNAQDATIDLVIAGSAAAPTITLPAPPATPILRGISVSLTPSAVTGGVRELRYYLDDAATPFKTVNLPPYQAGTSTLGLTVGSHHIDAVAVDGLGQTGQARYNFTVGPNTNAPKVALAGATSGATYLVGSSFVVSGSASDPVGIASLTYALDGTPLTVSPGVQSVTINTKGMDACAKPPCAHSLVVEAVNSLGVSGSKTLDFSVARIPNGPAPAAPFVSPVSAPSNGQVTISGASAAGARIDISNDTQKFVVTVNADATGRFTAGLAASSGDSLSVVAYDFTASQQPSPATVVVVPAAPVLDHITVAVTGTTAFTTLNQYSDVVVNGTYQGGGSANLTAQATFSSSAPAVASVNAAGRVVALKSGSATITANVAGQKAQVDVTVDIVTLDSITVAPQSLTFPVLGQTQQLTVTAHYSNSTTQTLGSGVSYISGSVTVSGVSPAGVVTANANGSTQINVSYPGVPPVQVAVTVDTALDTPPQVQIVSVFPGPTVERGATVTVRAKATDAVGGVAQVSFSAVGPDSPTPFASDTKQVSGVSDTTVDLSFQVPDTLAIGATITVTVRAVDTGNLSAVPAVTTFTVVDVTPPAVSISSPAPATAYNYGDTITLQVFANDAVGVTRIAYETTGAMTLSGSALIDPAAAGAVRTFSIAVPFGTPSSDLQIVARAQDAAGNVGASVPVHVIITGADVTPPATQVTAVAALAGNATATVTYAVTDGLADLDYVQLYFRRNGLGTFSLYLGALGDGDGKYVPAAGNVGTVAFDSTRMGGDGSYEFYTVGVDKAGNREPPPKAAYSLAASYPFGDAALDDSGNRNHGSAKNAPTLVADRFGRAGRAYQFNGTNQYIDIPDANTLDLTTDFTLAAWINPAVAMTDPGKGGILSKVGGSGGNNGYQLGVTGNNSQLVCQFNATGEAWGTNKVVAAVSPLAVNQWAHVVCTFDHDTLRLYLNGTLAGSQQVGAKSVANTSSHLRISSDDNSNVWFQGAIDDVVISRRALSGAEVATLSQIGGAGIAADQVADINAGTSWTVVTSDKTLGASDASLDNLNLRVLGKTLTVDGHHAFHNVELLNGAILTHSAATTNTASALDLSVWTLSVDAVSSVDVTGKGYLGGLKTPFGDAAQTLGFAAGAGAGSAGSYAGSGGRYSSATGATNATYGSLTNPTDLGSGGGAWAGSYTGGDGGGRVLLSAVNVVTDGEVKATGGVSTGSAAGDGSGGSLNIVAGTLSGAGWLRVDGGAGHVGGGGGRIAVRYGDMSTYDVQTMSASGATGSYGSGANGTIYVVQKSSANGALVIAGQGANSPWTDLVLPPGQTFDGITLQNGARLVVHNPLVIAGTVRLTGNSVLAHANADEAGLLIQAAAVVVEAGSAIDATGRGYLGGSSGPGTTLGALQGAVTGCGGTYGGRGACYGGSAQNPGLVYGDLERPNRLGSGGGSWAGLSGGGGGGFVRIIAAQGVEVEGAIRADGGLSAGSAAGDGSGGSVWITTSRLSGSGTISADGGGNGGHAGGGGGRVAVYYDYLDPNANLNGLLNLTAVRGHGNYDDRPSSAGTVYVRRSDRVGGDLYIDDKVVNAFSPAATALPLVGPGVAGAVSVDTLALDGGVSILPQGLVGLRFNPDRSQSEMFEIASNTATTVTVTTPNENGVPFAAVAAPGKSYAGAWVFDNVIFRRGGFLEIGDPLTVSGTLDVKEHGLLVHSETTTQYEGILDLDVGTLHVDATSRIDATGRGYLGASDSPSRPAQTVGFAAGAAAGSGGSYGGLGGHYSSGLANPTYGSLTDPVDLGSGGGAWGPVGGDGGGRVFVTANSILLDGSIRADGGLSGGSAAGNGSGGTVNIVTTSLDGSGAITANGGGIGSYTGGGGGRVAIRYYSASTLGLPQANVRAIGGVGNYGVGGHGTVFFKSQGQTYGDLVIDGFHQAQPSDTSVLPEGLTFDNIEIRNSASVVADGGVKVLDTLHIGGASVLTHHATDELGLKIEATRVVVDQGSSIDVTGRGYPGGSSGSGVTLDFLAGSPVGCGGSYGGRGACYDATKQPGLVYGDLRRPARLGSGGGSWGPAGGPGGGYIRLIATQSLEVDGAIRADGGLSGGSAAGSGSGGSVWITTSAFSGAGTISANGGGVGSYTGGGGGRVAIYYDSINAGSNFAGLLNITALRGRGNYDTVPAGAGTVYLKSSTGVGGDLYLDDKVVDASGQPNGTSPGATALPLLGPETAGAVGSNTLALGGILPILPQGLVGLRLNPDVSQPETFEIAANTANTVTVVSPNEHGRSFGSIAGAGKTYGGDWTFDNVIFRRGGFLEVGDPLTVSGTLDLKEYGLLTHPETTTNYAGTLEIDADTLNVDVTSRIDVSGRGYLGGGKAGLGDVAQTLGFAAGASAGSGGSYGGLGGHFGTGSATNPPYGSASNPRDLGSGGGAYAGTGGDGGGRVLISAGAMTVAGQIRADGGLSAGSASGDGSGGTVNIVAGTLAGAGSITANGGGNGGRVGGGGGRIAVRQTSSSPPALQVQLKVDGGSGSYGNGLPGTVHVEP